jgi:hypothetical protein
MSSAEARNNHASSDAAARTVDMHVDVQIIPVSGVDRSEQFYQRLGWRFDADVAPLDGLRIVQFTPRARPPRSRSAPGSPRPRPARPRAG